MYIFVKSGTGVMTTGGIYLSVLPGLADVACSDIPSNIMAHEQPPVMLHNKSSGHIESTMAGIVVCCADCFNVFVLVQNSSVCTLQVLLIHLLLLWPADVYNFVFYNYSDYQTNAMC